MIELADIQAFIHVAQLRSVSAAARVTGAPKSSVSRSLARLEAALESLLIERSVPRQLRLTDAGQTLLPHALRIMNEVGDAEAAVGRLVGTPHGTLRVSAPYAFALGAITSMLPGFLARYPGVNVVLLRDASWAELSASDADLIIRITPLPDTAMIARRLSTVELWTCASPSYLAARGAPSSVAALIEHDIVSLTGPDVAWSFRNAAGHMEELALRAHAVLPDTALVQSALVSGGGIGQLPEFMAAEAISRGELVRVLATAGAATAEAFALYHSHKSLSIKAAVFLDALAAHVAGLRRRMPPGA